MAAKSEGTRGDDAHPLARAVSGRGAHLLRRRILNVVRSGNLNRAGEDQDLGVAAERQPEGCHLIYKRADAEVGIGAGTRPVEPGHEVSDEGRRMPKRDYETSVQDEQIFVSVLANEDFTLVSLSSAIHSYLDPTVVPDVHMEKYFGWTRSPRPPPSLRSSSFVDQTAVLMELIKQQQLHQEEFSKNQLVQQQQQASVIATSCGQIATLTADVAANKLAESSSSGSSAMGKKKGADAEIA
ncbi:hypothetical protein CYMTET_38905 [Cymbomonas tetramitiformis]|uniref:Uncharacterized protein n=1 Tax=Cymbomonas tetramitiformis TaxID=36881 RepID=A0AAE0CC85_9CHLO|nr:hypothetical protein CYMTET_38905 [Cymbomonas tetramitiformis]